MATWTNIDDTFLEPGKPVRSVDGLALRDNPIAIAEGVAGAPRVQNTAFDNLTIGAEKLQTGTAERDWVLARTAAAAVGAVGTYGLFELQASVGVVEGQTTAGNSLRYSAAAGSGGGGGPSGTWRAMGRTGTVGPSERTTVFLRVS